MGKLFVPYELAVKLKEKGFDEYCFAYYDKNKILLSGGSIAHSQRLTNLKNSNIKNGGKEFIDCPTAPTYDQVIDWFIEKHKIQLKAVAMDFEGKVKWYYECQDIKLYKTMHIDQRVFRFKVMSPNISNTYHIALRKAISEAVKTI